MIVKNSYFDIVKNTVTKSQFGIVRHKFKLKKVHTTFFKLNDKLPSS